MASFVVPPALFELDIIHCALAAPFTIFQPAGKEAPLKFSENIVAVLPGFPEELAKS